MEAKDTVIKRKVNWIAFNQANLEKLLLEQAEISFKAGIKEVVEFVHQMWLHDYGYPMIGRADWQAKLKGWGV